jgi:hypothetical protein
VGELEACFIVHLRQLKTKSPFFEAALRYNFRERSGKTVHLPTDDVETVERYVQWLYSSATPRFSNDPEERYLELAQLYVFADKTQTKSLKLLLMGSLFALHAAGVLPSQDVINFSFQNLPDYSALRHVLVDAYVWHADLTWISRPSCMDELIGNPRFAAEVSMGMAKRIKNPKLRDPFSTNPGTYFLRHERFGRETGRTTLTPQSQSSEAEQ